MMSNVPSAQRLLATVGFLALAEVTLAWGQEPGQEASGPPAPPPGLVPALRADAVLARKLDAARDRLRAAAWPEAMRLLQDLLECPEDALVAVKRPGTDGKDITSWTGVRTEAARLLDELPAAGRSFDEARHGPRARALLAEGLRQGDLSLVAEVVRHYPHTAAGAEATALLGAYCLDRGRPALAACCYQRLLDGRGADGLTPATLFHAALAFRRSGDGGRAERAWKALAATAPGRLRLGGRAVSLDDLRKELEHTAVAGPAPGPAKLPDLEPRWTSPTAREKLVKDWLDSAVHLHEYRSQPALSGSFPLVVGGRLVYRSYRGVRAVDPQTGKEAWEAPSGWSADRMAAHHGHVSALEQWVPAYLDVSPHVLFENAVLGTLGTDGARVYAVDDLAVPPYRTYQRWRGRWQQEPAWPDFGPDLNDAISHSRLLALDAASGKVLWEVGGRGMDEEAGELDDSYFLGAPLSLDGRLYVLTEKSGEVRLACLRPADGAFVWKQALTVAPTRLLLDPGRRIQAVRPVYGEGILVCPTNAGLVVGVDLLTRGLAWAYPYRGEALTQSPAYEGRRGRPAPPRVSAAWKAPLTVVQDGRVLFTAADEPSVQCLRLRDGALLWKAERADDDLYVAGVVGGKVLVVGKQSCRALDLADGTLLWRLDTGLPSGRGVAVGGVYYLPLKEPVGEKEPAVYALDVEKGTILARTPPPRKEVPGNLLLWQGDVLSQTATAVTAFSEQKPKHEPKDKDKPKEKEQ